MSLVNSKSALVFILITICLDSIGLGIIIPSFPSLIAETAHVKLSQSREYFGWVMSAYAFMQFLFAPLVGNLSDRYGRRPVLLTSVCGMGLDYLVMYFAPDLFWLVLGRAVSGIFGASYTTAAAYIADISTEDNRARNFGMIGAAFGVGFIIGPAIGGLLSDFGTRAPFLVAAIFSLTNFIYGLLVLKESLPPSQRRSFEWLRANPLGAFLQMRRFKRMQFLFLVTFLIIFVNMCVQVTWNFYTMEKFGWTIRDVGISLTVVGVCFGLIQGGLSGFLVKRLGEKGAATLGIGTLIFVMVGIGLVPYGWLIYITILPYAFTGISDPAIRSIVSSQTSNNEQGELQGVFTSLMSLGEILGPIFFMWIYHSAREMAPNSEWSFGSPYFIAAFIAVVAFVLLRWTLKGYKKQE